MSSTRISNLDWSTIKLEELRKLPSVALKPTYRLSDDCGSGCAGDPPGFPTYFLRPIYTQQGNSPPRGYDLCIHHEGRSYGVQQVAWPEVSWEEHVVNQKALYRRLWAPLPLDHPRTQAWIAAAFLHLRACYLDPTLSGRARWDKLVIWPVPGWRLRKFLDDERFSDAWREKEKASVAQANEDIMAAARKVAVLDNHAAVVSTREYYPDFIPTDELVAGKFQHPGNWWEVMAERPSPKDCPGQYGSEHPVNGSWCQLCGWHAEKEKQHDGEE